MTWHEGSIAVSPRMGASRVLSRNLKLERYRQMFSRCKHARNAILHNIGKLKKYTESGGVSSLNWGVFTAPPPRGGGGCKNISGSICPPYSRHRPREERKALTTGNQGIFCVGKKHEEGTDKFYVCVTEYGNSWR